MPMTIEFPEADGVISVLLYANKGLAATSVHTRDGDGVTYDFFLRDGTVVTGTFYAEGWDEERGEATLVIATHEHGSPDGGRDTVLLSEVERIVYC